MKKTYIILASLAVALIGIGLVVFGISNAPQTKTSGEPLRIGINPWIGHGLYYVAIVDLKGKSVAFEVGSPSHFFLSYLLDKYGLTTDDLTVINTIAPDAGAAFVGGKVDAAVTWEPWLSKAGEREGGRLLATSKETPILPAILIFRTEVIKNRSKDIQAVLRALFAAREWILANQSEAVTIIARNFNITEQEVTEQLPTFRWLSYEDNARGFTEGEYSAQNLIQTAGDLWLKLGLIKNKVDASDLVDGSLLKNLYK